MSETPSRVAGPPVSRYLIYGIALEVRGTSAPLAAPPSISHPDTILHLGPFPAGIPLQPSEICYGSHTSNLHIFRLRDAPFLHVCFPEDIEFLVHTDTTVIYGNWPSQFALDYVAPLILGTLMGLLLRMKEVTTLHASVVELNGRATLITGAGGAGKSTTAAAFAKAGFPVLSDDLAPLRPTENSVHVSPGYPRICLWPESVQLLFGSPTALPLLTEGWEKRFIDTSHSPYRFSPLPLPVGPVYWITDRDDSPPEPSIAPMSPQESIRVLVGNTYASSFGARLQAASDLRAYASLLSRVPVRRVLPGHGRSALDQMCRLIEEDSATV